MRSETIKCCIESLTRSRFISAYMYVPALPWVLNLKLGEHCLPGKVANPPFSVRISDVVKPYHVSPVLVLPFDDRVLEKISLVPPSTFVHLCLSPRSSTAQTSQSLPLPGPTVMLSIKPWLLRYILVGCIATGTQSLIPEGTAPASIVSFEQFD